MISDHNLGALMGAPVTGPSNEKIGTVGQVFVDPDTGKPNWVTVQTGLFGRHESFVPVDDATWDREVLHVPFEKDVVKDAPRVDTDQALSAEDEISLYRYYRIPTGEVDPSTFSDGNADRAGDRVDERVDDRVDERVNDNQPQAAAPVAAHAVAEPERADDDRPIAERLAEATRRFVEKQKSGSDDSTQTRDEAEARTTADTEDLSETRNVTDSQTPGEQSSGRMRMRRYVIVEEEVPMDSDQGVPGTPGTHRDPQG